MGEAIQESNATRLFRISRQVGEEAEAAGMGVHKIFQAKLKAVVEADDGEFLAYLQMLKAQKDAVEARKEALQAITEFRKIAEEALQAIAEVRKMAEEALQAMAGVQKIAVNVETRPSMIVNDQETFDPRLGIGSARCDTPIDITEI